MAAMASAPQNNAGIASGVNHTTTRVGQVLIVGILGGLAITWFGQQLMNDSYIKSLPARRRHISPPMPATWLRRLSPIG